MPALHCTDLLAEEKLSHLFGDAWPTSGSIFSAVSSQIIPNQFHGEIGLDSPHFL